MPSFAKVLVVDDEAHLRAYVSMLVRDTLADIEVLEAADAESAVAQLAAHRPELVLLDINLVGASGLDVLPRLLAAAPGTVVVMLTAVNVRHAIEEAREKGASGYILKDASYEEMADSLREIVRENFTGANNPPDA